MIKRSAISVKCKKKGMLIIHSWHKVGDIEQKLRKLYSLNIQIFYHQGDRWIQTAGTDDITLSEQNEVGRKVTENMLHGRENPIEREKRDCKIKCVKVKKEE